MKRSYLNNLNKDQVDFLVEHYRQEWQRSEQVARRHELAEKTKIQLLRAGEFALKVLLVGGVVAVAVVAPNVFTAFGKLGKRDRFFFKDSKIKKTLKSYGGSSYICYKKTEANEYRVQLTAKGRKLAMHHALQNFKLQKQGHWDGKWRMVIFDVPKKLSVLRDLLRKKLKEIGMQPLQESVFMYPYVCENEVNFWCGIYGLLKPYVYCLEISHGKNLDFLKKDFKLV